jgi:mRNA interferase RelE/StbE
MYEIVFSKSAEEDFQSLPEEIQDRVIGVLERISIKPQRSVKKLAGIDAHRLRVGKYRIILDINEKSKRLEILRIGHRETIYQ